MDLYLIRHPAVATAPGLCYGSSDVGLREAPAVGAALIAEKLAALTGKTSDAMRIFTSPLARCATVARVLTAQPRVDARLAELDFGQWEGLSWDAIPREEIDAWAADVTHGRPHGGESVHLLAKRTASWLETLNTHAVNDASRPHIAMTHAGVIRVMTAQALQLPLLTCLNWPVDMTGICHLTRVDAQRAWALARWNR